MKKRRNKPFFRALQNYITFFLLVAFIVSCCMILFVRTLADTMGLVFDKENIAQAAKLTFGNVLLISLISSTIDYNRRKLMVDRPVKQIMEALDQVMQGDFTVRIAPVKEFAGETGFNEIISAINKMTAELQGTETLQFGRIYRQCIPRTEDTFGGYGKLCHHAPADGDFRGSPGGVCQSYLP